MFLYAAWSKVFNDDGTGRGATFVSSATGVMTLESWHPPIEAAVAVRWLRQLTCCFSKLQLPYEDTQVQAVLDRFIANEKELAEIKGALWRTRCGDTIRFPHYAGGEQTLKSVLLSARRIIHKSLCNVDPRDILPRHGSGASACRTRPWERYDRVLFSPDQNAIWPWLEFASSGREHCSQLLSTDFITDGYPRIARGVFVPKDYRGPRLISCEPATSMYFQQGLMAKLVSHFERHRPTRKFVNFTNQTINQVLAREGSITRKLGTLDLKDASDRLSWDLVILLWPNHWYRALSAVRSKVTEIAPPSGRAVRVPLRKHAPMGSAVCFPVMAFTIWALIKAAPFTSARANAWVYGDDLIVASKDAENVCKLLEAVGLTVNRDKSFYGGSPFRESCGKEYWDGFDTTPVYCRYNPLDDDTEIGSLCSFANNYALSRGFLASIGLTEVVHELTGAPIVGCWDGFTGLPEYEGNLHMQWLTANVSKTPSGMWSGEKPYPHLLYGAMCLCQRRSMRRRTNRKLQVTEYRIRRPYPVDVKIKPESWGYVLRSALIGGDTGFTESAALTKRVVYKHSWVRIPHFSHADANMKGGSL